MTRLHYEFMDFCTVVMKLVMASESPYNVISPLTKTRRLTSHQHPPYIYLPVQSNSSPPGTKFHLTHFYVNTIIKQLAYPSTLRLRHFTR